MNFFWIGSRRVLFPLFLAFWFLVPASEALDEGDLAPKFILPSLLNEDRKYSLEEGLGLVVYVDFWASWCAPCRLSMPALEQLYKEFADDGFHVFAVNVDAVREEATSFLEDFPVSYPILADPEGIISERYNVTGMPFGYLINRKGRIAHSHMGFRRGDEEVLRQMIGTELEK